MTTLETPSPAVRRDRRADTIRLLAGCVFGVIALHAVQIGAAFADLDPHPDGEVVPIIAAIAAIGIVAAPMLRAGDRLGLQLAVVFAGLSMIGMGPHKLFLENGTTIAPVALVGFVAEVTIIVGAVRQLRTPR